MFIFKFLNPEKKKIYDSNKVIIDDIVTAYSIEE